MKQRDEIGSFTAEAMEAVLQIARLHGNEQRAVEFVFGNPADKLEMRRCVYHGVVVLEGSMTICPMCDRETEEVKKL